MKGNLQIRFLAIVFILLSFGAGALPAFGTITGDPSTDGWVSEGNSAGEDFNSAGSTAPVSYSANLYSTLFTLTPSSPLYGAFDWSSGDLIVGVGGVFDGANTALTYGGPSGSTSTQFMVEFGSGSATWAAAPSGLGADGEPTASSAFGSLAHGGVGSVGLETAKYVFSPSDTGDFLVPSASDQEQSSSSGVAAISDNVGRVVTDWSDGSLVGFETFVDLTLLDEEYPTSAVAPGDKVVIDLVDGTEGSQYSVMESSDTLVGAPVFVPDRGWTLGLLAVAGGVILAGHRRFAGRRGAPAGMPGDGVSHSSCNSSRR